MMKRSLTLLAALLAAFACGEKNDPVDPTPEAPKTLTVSKTSFEIAQAGETVSIDISSPTRPILSGRPDWITYKDGTYKDYKMTVQLVVSANETTTVRTAEMSFMASGVTPVKVTVTQQAKEAPEPPTPTPGGDNDAWRRGMELGLGWNMGNQLDAINNGVSNETCWGNPKATQATFSGVKAAGFTSVRIPVTWMGHIGAAPEYKIEDAWMDRVFEVVGYAEKAGLKVILNTHHDENHGDSNWLDLKGAVDSEAANKRIKEEIASVWSQIALKFKDKGDFLMFESFNELIYGNEWGIGSNPTKKARVINEWNQLFVDTVRGTGGNNATRWLGVPGYASNPRYLTYFTLPTDSAGKTMVAFHCYDPYDYTIGDKQLANWGHTGNAYPNGEREIEELFSSLFSTYISKNIPIYMGEFGCSFRSKADKKAWAYFLYYLEYVVKAARTYGLASFLWDNGGEAGFGKEKHCYINHGTGQFFLNGKEPVDVMVKAWSSTDAAYTLQSVYDKAPKF